MLAPVAGFVVKRDHWKIPGSIYVYGYCYALLAMAKSNSKTVGLTLVTRIKIIRAKDSKILSDRTLVIWSCS